MTDEPGIVYLIHFDRPFGHARHYLGWTRTRNFEARIAHHRAGTGSNLMRHVTAAGIGWRVIRTWHGTRSDERRLKGHSSTRYCPACQGHPCIPST